MKLAFHVFTCIGIKSIQQKQRKGTGLGQWPSSSLAKWGHKEKIGQIASCAQAWMEMARTERELDTEGQN